MARPRKQTVDYFPHNCVHKSTMFIIEQRFGNDGYSFWFKLLELLGATEGHYIDLNDDMQMEFLQAKTRLSYCSCNEILNTLCILKAIDQELWSKRVIWCQNFVDNISDVYKNRKVSVPIKPVKIELSPVETGLLPVETTPEQNFYSLSTGENRQSKGKERKETPLPPSGGIEDEKSLEDQKTEIPPPSDANNKPPEKSPRKSKAQQVKSAAAAILFEQFWEQYPKKKSRGQAEKTWAKINPNEQLLSVMLKAISEAKEHNAQWRKDRGQFIPNPSTWLNAKGWMDEHRPAISSSANPMREFRADDPSINANPKEH
jgi:hypothetical protein